METYAAWLCPHKSWNIFHHIFPRISLTKIRFLTKHCFLLLDPTISLLLQYDSYVTKAEKLHSCVPTCFAKCCRDIPSGQMETWWNIFVVQSRTFPRSHKEHLHAREIALRTLRGDYSNIYENLEQSGDDDKVQSRRGRRVLEAENGNGKTKQVQMMTS